MSNRYGVSFRNGSGGGSGYGNMGGGDEDYDPFGDGYGSKRYGTPPLGSPRNPSISSRNMPSRPPRIHQNETNAEKKIGQVLDHIKTEWPAMCENDCVPVQLALQLLDTSSVGRAHEYRKFQETHTYLQDSLKGIVHEHHQGFNSSIGTFHKIQGSIQASQKKVRALKESLAASKTSLCSTDLELKKHSKTSQGFDDLLQTLNELDDLRAIPDQLEARISEKKFLSAVEVLHGALRKLRRPELDGIGALNDLRGYLANQETALMDILVEELHEHLYLKSPYCQDRWQSLSKAHGSYNESFNNASQPVTPFYMVLDAIDVGKSVIEDPMKNPESDTFYYITLLVESLNKLGRLQNAVEMLKQRLPVELFGIVNETIHEVDQRHPSSLRGVASKVDGALSYGPRETQPKSNVIEDLLHTLYGKFEAIAEGHRVFHESIKALIRREGAGNNSALLGSFKELWNLYQNEIRSLLHNYVTTDADVYQFDSPNPTNGINGKKEAIRDNLFKFAEADAKSVGMVTEYDALESIIQATVPGLTSTSRKQPLDSKRGRPGMDDGVNSRRGGRAGYGHAEQSTGSYKSLVQPSVFNMSLLMSPTLKFLHRLRGIVPPGSDLATSTLTTFLDNFLVNVFQPQLDETLGNLADNVFGEADSFVQDPLWKKCSRRPVFKGTTAFFDVVTAFCRMLGTIPPDQAVSSLIVTQMVRYYDRCFTWFQSLVTKTQDQGQDSVMLRASARYATEPGEVHETMKKQWLAEGFDADLAQHEIHLLIEETNQSRMEMNDIIQDRDTIGSLCLLYTSMRWLASKISNLRHITAHETDSSRQHLNRKTARRWTLLNEASNAALESEEVKLPLTQDTVQAFDTIVSSYEELASTALLTLHMEVRCRVVYSLRLVLSPEIAPYLLDQEVREPDPLILGLNSELVLFDETVARYLPSKEVEFARTGLGRLINTYLITNACIASPMNEKGCGRMQLNILVLQQNLKNVEKGVDLAQASNYYSLFEQGADAMIIRARRAKIESGSPRETDPSETFTFEEYRALVELCFSERMANPERGIASAARRQMEEQLRGLEEQPRWTASSSPTVG